MLMAEHSTRVSITLVSSITRLDSRINLINIGVFVGSRATSIFRFGFISLDLISIVLQDSGEYLCRVVSSTGVAESRATLSVTRKYKKYFMNFFRNYYSRYKPNLLLVS